MLEDTQVPLMPVEFTPIKPPSRQSTFMKKAIIGYLVVFFLLIGTVVALKLVNQNQNLRRKASTGNVDLSLNAPTTVTVGQPFTVAVIIDQTNARQVTAADIQLNVSPAASVRLDSITKGNYFSTPNMAVPPNYTGFDTVGTELLKDLTTGRYAVGALCDYCYMGGAAPNPNTYNIVQCPASPAPVCYPKTTTGTLATYTYTALTAGDITITLPGTQISAIDSDTNVAGDFNPSGGKVITITSATTTPPPSPTVTITPSSCTGDTNGDHKVNSTDFNLVVSNFAPLATCPTGNPCTGDVNGDHKVNSTDFNLVVSNFAPLVTCN